MKAARILDIIILIYLIMINKYGESIMIVIFPLKKKRMCLKWRMVKTN